jgi:hypothetical protein
MGLSGWFILAVALTTLSDMTGIRPSLISASRRRLTLKTSLLHWWDLSASVATLNDQHGSLNLTRTGTLDTESTLAPDGGSCVSNNGSVGYFRNSSVSAMTGWATGFSVNIWARRTSNSANNLFVSHQNFAANQQYFYFLRSSAATQNQIVPRNSAGLISVLSIADTVLETWSMFTMTIDNAEINAFKNGVFITSIARTGTPSSASAPFAFFDASWAPDASTRHIGQLFACGIWSRALQQNDITNLYNSGAGRRYSSL